MILQRLTIKDIGTFRGRVDLDLTPAADAPIVLIGGKNGTGKTTLLEVIQWVLYGPLARTSRRDSNGATVAYPKYLQELRHRSIVADGRPYAQLHFQIVRDGKEVPVVVTRTIPTNDAVRDGLSVDIAGEPLASPADEWPTMIDGILPVGLCPLYFFDGEQVETLANPEASGEFLQAGLHALLGLDIIDQLTADLGILRRRTSRAAVESGRAKSDAQRALLEHQLQDVDTEISTVEASLSSIRGEPGALSDARNEVSRAEALLRRAESKFKRDGKDYVAMHSEVESRLRSLREKKKSNESDLRQIVDGVLPLVMLHKKVAQLRSDVALEEGRRIQASEARAIDEELEALARWLRNRSIGQKTLTLVEEYRTSRASAAKYRAVAEPSALYKFVDLKRIVVDQLPEHTVLDAMKQSSRLCREIDQCIEAIGREESRKSRLPGDDAIRFAQETYEDAVRNAAEARGRVEKFIGDVHRMESKLAALRAKRDRLHQAIGELIEMTERAVRVDRASGEAIQLLGEFRKRIAQKHLQSIQDAIWLRVRELLRKRSLGSGVRINFDTYSLELLDESGTGIPPTRLSAGERQLLATATLWGMADVAKRRLPVVIDTPLGRLDRSHRENLVTHYFPRAGAQVLLLSTDEEVHGRWYKLLEKHVARSYTLEFDDRDKCTRVRTGYFEEAAAHVA